jgi:hypothetical protein
MSALKSCARKNEEKIGKEKNLSEGYVPKIRYEKHLPLTWFFSEDGAIR